MIILYLISYLGKNYKNIYFHQINSCNCNDVQFKHSARMLKNLKNFKSTQPHTIFYFKNLK